MFLNRPRLNQNLKPVGGKVRTLRKIARIGSFIDTPEDALEHEMIRGQDEATFIKSGIILDGDTITTPITLRQCTAVAPSYVSQDLDGSDNVSVNVVDGMFWVLNHSATIQLNINAPVDGKDKRIIMLRKQSGLGRNIDWVGSGTDYTFPNDLPPVFTDVDGAEDLLELSSVQDGVWIARILASDLQTITSAQQFAKVESLQIAAKKYIKSLRVAQAMKDPRFTGPDSAPPNTVATYVAGGDAAQAESIVQIADTFFGELVIEDATTQSVFIQIQTVDGQSPIDLSLGTYIILTHNADIDELEFTNIPLDSKQPILMERVKDNTVTPRNINFANAVMTLKTEGGEIPSLTQEANGRDFLVFLPLDAVASYALRAVNNLTASSFRGVYGRAKQCF